jgi:uncharacterized Zn-binding protein involved in type VI secretion
MPQAARQGDPTDHGGVIVSGSPDTTIGGIPAARQATDSHGCPNHGTVPIVTGSPTVLIDGTQAARVGDKLACGSAIASGCATVLFGDAPPAYVPGPPPRKQA